MNGRSHLLSIFLVFMAAFLSAYWLMIDRNRISDGEREVRSGKLFPAWRKQELTFIELKVGEQVLRLVSDLEGKKGAKNEDQGQLFFAHFRMSSPFNADLEWGIFDQLLTSFVSASYLRKVELSASSAHVFDSPQVQGKLHMGDLRYAFEVGEKVTYLNDAYYMHIDYENERHNYIINGELVRILFRPPETYRKRQFISSALSTWQSVEIKKKDGHYTFLREDELHFLLTEPVPLFHHVRASRMAFDKLGRIFSDLRAEYFLEPHLLNPMLAYADEKRDEWAKELGRAKWGSVENQDLVLLPITFFFKTSELEKPQLEVSILGPCLNRETELLVTVNSGGETKAYACVFASAFSELPLDLKALVARSPFSIRLDEASAMSIAIRAEAEQNIRVHLFERKNNGFVHRIHVEDQRDLISDVRDASTSTRWEQLGEELDAQELQSFYETIELIFENESENLPEFESVFPSNWSIYIEVEGSSERSESIKEVVFMGKREKTSKSSTIVAPYFFVWRQADRMQLPFKMAGAFTDKIKALLTSVSEPVR